MSKKIIFGLVALAAASAFALQNWYGSHYRVDTELDDGSDESGYWYAFNDSTNGGNSTITFGRNGESGIIDSSIIDVCDGLCGEYTLSNAYRYPFVGVGFNLTGSNQTGADVTDWGGLCLIYSTTGTAPTLEIAPEDEATTTEYNNYASKLAIAASATKVTLAWSAFKQESGWGVTVAQATYLTEVAAVKFKISGTAGKAGTFNIVSIGTAAADDCTAYGPPPAIKATKAASAIKAQLSNRTLSFTGITGTAKAEIVNLQGEVVLRGAASANASMDLAALEAGIYLVRVAGKSVNFSKKIVLK